MIINQNQDDYRDTPSVPAESRASQSPRASLPSCPCERRHRRPPGPAQFALRLRLHLPRKPRGNTLHRRHDQAQPPTQFRCFQNIRSRNPSTNQRPRNRDLLNQPCDALQAMYAKSQCGNGIGHYSSSPYFLDSEQYLIIKRFSQQGQEVKL